MFAQARLLGRGIFHPGSTAACTSVLMGGGIRAGGFSLVLPFGTPLDFVHCVLDVFVDSGVRAMAAAEPSPAAVITCARGLAALPATNAGTLVRPVASICTNPSSSISQPQCVDEAGACVERSAG